MYWKTIFSSVIDATLASDNPSRFKKKSFRKNIKTNHEN